MSLRFLIYTGLTLALALTALGGWLWWRAQ